MQILVCLAIITLVSAWSFLEFDFIFVFSLVDQRFQQLDIWPWVLRAGRRRLYKAQIRKMKRLAQELAPLDERHMEFRELQRQYFLDQAELKSIDEVEEEQI